MKIKKIIAMLVLLLVITMPITLADFNDPLLGGPYEDVGEAVVVNVDAVEPALISESYLRQQNVPVMAYLTGTTLGTLFDLGDPLSGSVNIPPIRKVNVKPIGDTVNYVRRPRYIRPDRRYYSLSNLGQLLIVLNRRDDTEPLPENLKLDFEAEIFFNVEEGLYGVSSQDLVVDMQRDETVWKDQIAKYPEKYSFFSQQGYIRATKIENDRASFAVYNRALSLLSAISPTTDTAGLSLNNALQLKRGEVSRDISFGYTGDPLRDRFRVRLNNIISPQEKAVVDILAGGNVFRRTLIKGMRVFDGSDWTVERIYISENNQVHRLVLTNSMGDSKTIETTFDGSEEGALSNLVNLFNPSDVLDLEVKYCPFDLNDVQSYDYACQALRRYQILINDYPNTRSAMMAGLDIGKMYARSIGKTPIFDRQNVNYDEFEKDMRSLAVYYFQSVTESSVVNENSGLADSATKELEWIRKGTFGDDYLEGEDVEVKLISVQKPSGTQRPKVDIRAGGGKEIPYYEGDFLRNQVGEIFEGRFYPGHNIDTRIERSLRDGHAVLGGQDDRGQFYNFRWKIEEGSISPTSVKLTRYYESNSGFNVFGLETVVLPLDRKKSLSAWYFSDPLIKSPDQKETEVDYEVTNIQTMKEAHITILPGTGELKSVSNFSVYVDIETKPPLNPEKINERIVKYKEQIEKLDRVITSMDKMLKAWRKTCVGVFMILTAKNFLSGGRNAARQDVMQHYKDECSKQEGKTLDQCYNDLSKQISTDLDAATNSLQKATEDSRILKERYDSMTQEQRIALAEDPNSDATLRDYVKFRLTQRGHDQYKNYLRLKSYGQEEGLSDGFKNFINNQSDFVEVSNTLAKYDELVGSDFCKNLNNLDISDCVRYKVETERLSKISKKINNIKGLENAKLIFDPLPAKSGDSKVDFIGVVNGEPKKLRALNQCEYDLFNDGVMSKDSVCAYNTLEISGGRKVYVDAEIYNTYKGTIFPSGRIEEGAELGAVNSLEFYTTGITSYGDQQINRNYAYDTSITAEYDQDGLALCYPVGDGNYVHVLNRYRRGGVESFRLVNVGPNGRIDCGSGGDDVLITHESAWADKRSEQAKLTGIVEGAPRCAEDGQLFGKKVDGLKIKCSMSQSKINKMQAQPACAETMDPSDCKLLFNACDPVMCPASRCNLGGNLPIETSGDVISSGLIGSSILCLPNAKEGIVVPVCLTGIKAGLENIKSLLQSYVDCMDEQLETGKDVGICDKIRSIGWCEIVWRESTAILQAKGGVFNWIAKKTFGGEARGGNEYLNFQSSLQAAGDSFNYFTKTYSQTYLAAYKGKSTDEIGGEICKKAIKGKFPKPGELLDQLSSVQEPPQFTAYFDAFPEITQSGVAGKAGIRGVPYGTKELYRYDVFYHIYAGNGFGDIGEDLSASNTELDPVVVYSVFLKDDLGNVLYVTTPEGSRTQTVKLGDYAQRTVIRPGPAGLNQICVSLNGRVSCGFGKTSSDVTIGLIGDELSKSEALNQISNENQCVPEASRTAPALGSITTPGELGLLSTGITRVCGHLPPTEQSNRWRNVGTCGEDESGLDLGTCWLDISSINIEHKGLREGVIKSLEERHNEYQGLYPENVIDEVKSKSIYNEIKSKILESIGRLTTMVENDKNLENQKQFNDQVQEELNNLKTE